MARRNTADDAEDTASWMLLLRSS